MIDVAEIETPAFVCDLRALDRNVDLLADVQARAGCKILVALKGFAMWSIFDRIAKALPGVTASSTHEARLGREEFGGEVHACAPAYSDADFRELLTLCDHIVLNSPTQLARLRPLRDALAPKVELGLRVNPEHREVEVELYDPCAPRSRLGTTAAALHDTDLQGVAGLHFHTLCELGSDALERTVAAFEAKFGHLLPGLRWINMGGGHHITRPGYDVDRLVRVVSEFRERHGVDVYLEPGEAVALNTGVLVASVLDVLHNDVDIAILDVSATAHMPDVLEMPYRPTVTARGGARDEGAHLPPGRSELPRGRCCRRLRFRQTAGRGRQARIRGHDPLHDGEDDHVQRGAGLPSIVTLDASGRIDVQRRFGYEDYKSRLS